MNKTYQIKNVLNNISKPLTGLTLITNPTGSGKSYETSLFIAEWLINNEKYLKNNNGNMDFRRVYFLTPRLKNLDDLYQGIKQALIKKNKEELFDKVLKIDSFRNSVIKNKSFIMNDTTEDWIETYNLIRDIDQYTEYKTHLTSSEKTEKSKLEKRLFGSKDATNSLERTFRKKLHKEFNKSYQDNKYVGQSKLNFMQENKEWNFIEKLYPSSLTSCSEVFIMTAKKFFIKNDPIINKPYLFTDSEDIENSLILIDEIDAVKTDMYDIILDNNLHMDLIDTFKVIYTALQHKFEETFFVNGFKNFKEDYLELQNEAKRLKELYLPAKWEIQYFEHNKEFNDIEKIKVKNKIMSYQGKEIISAGNNDRYLPLLLNVELPLFKECNKILPYNPQTNNGTYPIYVFLNKITNFLNNAFVKFYYIAMKYNSIRSNLDDVDRDEIFNNSITTILKYLNIDTSNAEKFANYINILMENKFSKKHNKLFLFENNDKSFYKNGINYNCVSEIDKFQDSSILTNYKIPCTPELMLASLSKKAHVIGISATAEIPSIHNFNLDFLKDSLLTKYHYISNKDKKLLLQDYHNKTIGYKDNNLSTLVKKINVNEYPYKIDDVSILHSDLIYLLTNEKHLSKNEIKDKFNDVLLEINDCEERLQGKKIYEIQDDLIKAIPSNEYDYLRLKKVFLYIRDLLMYYDKEHKHSKDKVISNGIIITQKSIKKHIQRNLYNDSFEIYTLDALKLGTTYICSNIFNLSFPKAAKMANEMFITIDAEDLKDNDNDKIKKCENYFKENKPIFMITTYASASRGNNLQIKIGKKEVKKRIENKALFPINNWENKGYVDWDSLYIERPTHIIPTLKDYQNKNSYNARNQLTQDDLKLLITVEEASEHENLSQKQQEKILNEVFSRFNGESIQGIKYNQLYGIESVRAAYTSYIYQTIGRISRTNVKKKKNALFFDQEIMKSIHLNTDKLNLFNVTHEFKKFITKLQYEILEENDCSAEFSRRNNYMFNFIKNLLDIGWQENKELKLFWEDLRSFILTHPVISEENLVKAEHFFNKYNVISELGFCVQDLYINFNQATSKYSYSINNDFYNSKNDFEFVQIPKDISVQDNLKVGFNCNVSIKDSRLNKLLEIRDIKKHWVKNNYNLNWEINKNEKFYGIISPIIYNNIYKGALGEEVLKVMLSSLGMNCEEITEHEYYEKFDFVINKNNKKIYIDAKNFSPNTIESDIANEELIKKVNIKNNTIKPDHIFIINLIEPSGHMLPQTIPKENVTIIPGIFTHRNKNDDSLIINEKMLSKIENVFLDKTSGVY